MASADRTVCTLLAVRKRINVLKNRTRLVLLSVCFKFIWSKFFSGGHFIMFYFFEAMTEAVAASVAL